MQELGFIIFLIVLLYILLKGTVKVFYNYFWLAILMLFLLFPLLLIWIIVEGLTINSKD